MAKQAAKQAAKQPQKRKPRKPAAAKPSQQIEGRVKLPQDGEVYWKSPQFFAELGATVVGIVTQEHVDMMNRNYLQIGHPDDEPVADLRPGKGWTLDYDPIEKRKQEMEIKRRKALGLNVE